jgi:hypothetical protein
MRQPSSPDLSAAYNNITSVHNGHLKTWHLPIIQSAADGRAFEFHAYIVSCSQDSEPLLHTPKLVVVSDGTAKAKKKTIAEEKPKQSEMRAMRASTSKISAPTLERLNNDYQRVSKAVDFSKMLTTSIIQVGVGASSTVIEQFSRLGAKRWILFDPDTVERKNLVAQDFEIGDIGKLKCVAMRERMVRCEFEKGATDIPPLRVDTYEDFLGIDDTALDALIEEEKRCYDRVILVMATDFHPAQARGARVGLRHSLPTFFVGVYTDGLAGELIFHHPEAKEMACYRCTITSRYAAFDKRKTVEKTAARSSGLPFAIGILDSQLAHLIIGCIHYDGLDMFKSPSNVSGEFFGELLREKRGFIQTQMSSSYRMGGVDIFRDEQGVHGDNVKTFISMFQKDEKNPQCPDCSMPWAWTHTDYTK